LHAWLDSLMKVPEFAKCQLADADEMLKLRALMACEVAIRNKMGDQEIREAIRRHHAVLLPEPANYAAGTKPLILLVGVHRTLSSCLAMMLEQLGVWMGNTRPTSGEDRQLARLCESLMPFPSAVKSPSAGKIGQLVRKHMRHEGPCGLKYPTLCAYLDEIAEVWPNLKIIHCSRPLEESIASLATRSQQPRQFPATPPECELIQRYLHDRLLAFLANRNHLTIEASDLFVDPQREIRRIANYLDIAPSAEQITQAAAIPDPAKAPHSTAAGGRETAHWEDATTICIKTFERPDSLDQCIASIRHRHPTVKIFVCDDSRKPRWIVPGADRVFVKPFDSGLSAGRNHLLAHVETPYVMMLDDDMEFTDETDVDRLYQDVRLHGVDLAAGIPSKRPLVLKFPASLFMHENDLVILNSPAGLLNHIPFYRVVHNCFLARTKRLPKWDERLKLGEHIEYFIRGWREHDLRCSFRPEVKVLDSQVRPNDTFREHRSKAKEYADLALYEWCKRLGANRVLRQPQGTVRFSIEEYEATHAGLAERNNNLHQDVRAAGMP